MKYLQSFTPFQLLTAIARIKNNKETLEQTRLTENQQESCCTYEQAEEFVVGLRRSVSEAVEKENALKRKISLYERIQVEPHYLQSTSAQKMIEFQFHLGTNAFPQRTEALHQQVSEVMKAIREITRSKGQVVQQYFQNLERDIGKVNELIKKVQYLRDTLSALKQRKQMTINRLLFRKARIKQKLALLKKVKTKNQAAFLEINNIDQAFATEQSRVKLYRKLTKLTQLDRSKYVGTIKNKLIASCRGNKKLVEQGLGVWASGGLTEKQVQKLVFMVYFMQKQEIYRENQIKIDYSLFDAGTLRQQIVKIFTWKDFHYMRDNSSRQRIHQFLNFLLTRIQ